MVAAMVTVACDTASASSRKAPSGGTLTYGFETLPDSLDPASAVQSTSEEVIKAIYNTLVYLDPTNRKFVPGLATSWSINKSGTVYTFHLRRGVRFQDGSPFNAAAVKYSFDRLSNPALKSTSALTSLGPYKGSQAVNATTVKVSFTQSYPGFLTAASQTPLSIVSPTAAKKWGSAFGQHPVGTGPFTFVSWTPGGAVTVQRNAAYHWGPKITSKSNVGPAHLNEIVFDPITDPNAAVAALQSGTIDVLERVPASNFGQLRSQFGAYSMIPSGAPYLLFVNTEKAPTDDLKVRQALAMGLDPVQATNIAWFGQNKAAAGILSPATIGYDPSTAKIYKYNLQQAEQVLTSDGWTVGSGGIRQKNGQKLVLTFETNSTFEAMATAVQGLLKPLGVQVDVRVAAAADAATFASNGNNNLSLTGYLSSDPVGTLSFFFSSKNYGGYDWSRIKDPMIDSLLADAASNPSPAKRIKDLDSIQQRIVTQVYAIGLSQVIRLFAYAKSVGGFHTDTVSYPYWEDLYLKK